MDTAIHHYLEQDRYLKLLGATIEEVRAGYARVSMTLTSDMLNFHGIGHGGALMSLGGMAFGCACNSHGTKAVAIDVAFSFMRGVKAGDILTAVGNEINLGARIGVYQIDITNQLGELVARGQGTAFRSNEQFTS